MKIKKGDKVVVIAGKDRGKNGVVLRALPSEEKVIVEGVNVAKKHQRGRRGQGGQIIEKTLPVHVSNVALADPKNGKPTRIGITRKDGARLRIAKKSGSEIK